MNCFFCTLHSCWVSLTLSKCFLHYSRCKMMGVRFVASIPRRFNKQVDNEGNESEYVWYSFLPVCVYLISFLSFSLTFLLTDKWFGSDCIAVFPW